MNGMQFHAAVVLSEANWGVQEFNSVYAACFEVGIKSSVPFAKVEEIWNSESLFMKIELESEKGSLV